MTSTVGTHPSTPPPTLNGVLCPVLLALCHFDETLDLGSLKKRLRSLNKKEDLQFLSEDVETVYRQVIASFKTCKKQLDAFGFQLSDESVLHIVTAKRTVESQFNHAMQMINSRLEQMIV